MEESPGRERRNFIRHPSDVPIEIVREETGALRKAGLKNVSVGGLCFISATRLEPDSLVNIRIPLLKPAFEAKGRVVWCRGHADLYDVGVVFTGSALSFKVRMVEQLCYIEHYKNEIMNNEGRRLSGEEAALEWIERYALKFPV